MKRVVIEFVIVAVISGIAATVFVLLLELVVNLF